MIIAWVYLIFVLGLAFVHLRRLINIYGSFTHGFKVVHSLFFNVLLGLVVLKES